MSFQLVSKWNKFGTGGNRQVAHTVKASNLDAVISVGYRVNSERATHFRRWATSVLDNTYRVAVWPSLNKPDSNTVSCIA